jgi:hypothetical protein
VEGRIVGFKCGRAISAVVGPSRPNTPTKTIRPGTNSYRLKHIAENYVCRYPEGEVLGPRYVTNGAFIAAAIHAGFKHKYFFDHLGYERINVDFNMPKATIDALDLEIRPDSGWAQDQRRKVEMRNLQRNWGSRLTNRRLDASA